MPLQYRDILVTITDLLAANTATLDDSVTTSTRLITRGDPNNVPVQVTQYPAIFVQLSSKNEDFAQIGQRKKDITLNFNVYGLVQLSTNSDSSDREIQNFARNIETVLRTANGVVLSNTVLYSNPKSASFDTAFKDGIWLSSVLIDLECKILTT